MNFFRQMNRRTAAAAAVSAGLLVPLGILGAPALAGSASSAYAYQYKITVCHKTHSKKHPWHVIKVSSASWKAHQKHGDFLVTSTATPCPPVAPAAPTTTSSTHGNSGNHGNNGNNGNNGKAKGHGK